MKEHSILVSKQVSVPLSLGSCVVVTLHNGATIKSYKPPQKLKLYAVSIHVIN